MVLLPSGTGFISRVHNQFKSLLYVETLKYIAKRSQDVGEGRKFGRGI